MERLPLMEGEGEALRVLGFNHKDRAEFLDILVRFGVGDYDWKDFIPRMTHKTDKEIRDYGFLFLSHIADNITDSPTFKDGVPKEGLQIQDVLCRISVMTLISYKVRFAAAQTPLFSDDISSRYSELKGAKTWTDEQDLALLKGLLKHGHGRWQDIVDDEDLKIQEVICQELNLPVPLLGEVDSQAQNCAQGSGDAWDQPQLHQDSSILYGFRDTQVEFIEKRVLLLEKVLHAEYRKELSDDFGDIIRYDSMELFAEENDEAVKSHQICYDEAAFNWLLDCDEVGDEETPSDDEDVNGFLKGLKTVYVKDDNLAGLEDNYEAELTDDESNSIWATTATRPYKKSDSTERLPLMEGEGEALKILGFNHKDRAEFLDILMRFGVGYYDWKDFIPRMTHKTDKEIHDYGFLFLSHLGDVITDSPTFTDGVPKEGLQIQHVLRRIPAMTLISRKVRFAAAQTPLFSDDISSRFSEVKGAKTWKEEQDLALLNAVMKHGYGRWQDIVDDKDLKIQEAICQELNIPVCGSQAQNGAQGPGDARNQPKLHQDSAILHGFTDTLVEFIEKRVLLLDKVLNADYHKEYSDKFGYKIRYDSKEIFAEENDEAVKSHQICYDAPAIDWLMDCDLFGDEETSSDDEDKNRFLKALKMVSVENDNLAGLKDNHEAELSNGQSNSIWSTTATRPYKKTVDSTERLPLMEGEGEDLKVLGFNHKDRAEFLDILMRFGVGDYDWKDFIPCMKHKTDKEIHDYGFLFLSHLADVITDSPTFRDGVPKEGLQIQHVLRRIPAMTLIRRKVSFAAAQTPLFSDDISSRFSELKGAKTWKEEQDLALLNAVMKHGYGRWQDIVDDKDLKIQEAICQELNLPVCGSQAQNGAQGSGDARNQPQLHQDSAILYGFTDTLVEFIEKRVLLLDKVLNAEYHKEYSGGPKTNGQLKSEPKASNVPRYESRDADTQMTDQRPLIVEIASEDISVACDNDPNRLELVQLHDEMGKVVLENPMDLVQTSKVIQPNW